MPKQPRLPNVQQTLAQLHKLQHAMEVAQEELKDEVVEASAGGGMVKVVVSGALELRSVTIDAAAVDPDDVEILSDMVLAAVNEGLRKAQQLAASKMGAAGVDLQDLGGLGLPGL